MSRFAMLAVVMFASASADWASEYNSVSNPCFVTPVDGVVTAAQLTAALANEVDPAVFPKDAFNQCKTLVTITLPTGITSIGNAAFAFADNLAGTVIIPEGVTIVGKFLFRDSPGLTTVIFPSTLTCINNHNYAIFQECTGLTTVCGATNLDLTAAFTQVCGTNPCQCNGVRSQYHVLGYATISNNAPFAQITTAGSPQSQLDIMTSACPAGLIPTPASSVADEEGGACSVKCCKGAWSGTDCTPAADGRILVQHDTTSAHSHHRCYEDDTHSRLCRCQCANSADAWD